MGKYKLNNIKVLIFKSLIDSYISQDEFVSINNSLREYNEIKSEKKKGLKFLRNILYKNG